MQKKTKLYPGMTVILVKTSVRLIPWACTLQYICIATFDHGHAIRLAQHCQKNSAFYWLEAACFQF